MFGSVSLHFANLVHVERWNLCSSLIAPFRDTKVVKPPFYSIGPKIHIKETKLLFEPESTSLGYQSCEASIPVQWTQNDVWECLDHIANLRHVKSWRTRVLGLNLLFWVTKVVKQPFYSIGPKMISRCVLEDFANLRQVKRCKTCVWAWMHYFKVSKLWSIHSTPLDPKWCFGVFRCISQTFGML
jgi:hypothetical protein